MALEEFTKFIPFLNNASELSFFDIVSWVAFFIGLGIIVVAFYFWYDYRNSIKANITLVDDRSGTRKLRHEKVLVKKYPSGNKYLVSSKSRVVIPSFPSSFIFSGGKGLDHWFGYLDRHGFVHAIDFLKKKVYFDRLDDGKVVVKEDALFMTIPQDLSDFYLKATEERVEKNKVLSLFEKMQPAMIMTACVFGAIIIVVSLALVR